MFVTHIMSPGPTVDTWQPALSIHSKWDVLDSIIPQDRDKNVCTSNSHLLNAFFVHTHLWENLFKNFAQDKGKESNGSHPQFVAHFLQDRTGFLSEGINRCNGLPGKLKGRQSKDEFWKTETRASFTQTNVINSKPTLSMMWLWDSVCSSWLDLTQLSNSKLCVIFFPALGKMSLWSTGWPWIHHSSTSAYWLPGL